MVEIDITRMAAGLHEVHLRPSVDALGLDPDAFSDIEAVVRLDVGGNQILARFTVAGSVTLVCDRSLVQYQQPVRGEFTVVYFSVDGESIEENETSRYLARGANEIDVTDVVRDTILLAIPLKHVAPEARDEELVLSYGPGGDDPLIDSRWEALKKLKDNS